MYLVGNDTRCAKNVMDNDDRQGIHGQEVQYTETTFGACV